MGTRPSPAHRGEGELCNHGTPPYAGPDHISAVLSSLPPPLRHDGNGGRDCRRTASRLRIAGCAHTDEPSIAQNEFREPNLLYGGAEMEGGGRLRQCSIATGPGRSDRDTLCRRF